VFSKLIQKCRHIRLTNVIKHFRPASHNHVLSHRAGGCHL